jgi:hypothetical protein
METGSRGTIAPRKYTKFTVKRHLWVVALTCSACWQGLGGRSNPGLWMLKRGNSRRRRGRLKGLWKLLDMDGWNSMDGGEIK